MKNEKIYESKKSALEYAISTLILVDRNSYSWRSVSYLSEFAEILENFSTPDKFLNDFKTVTKYRINAGLFYTGNNFADSFLESLEILNEDRRDERDLKNRKRMFFTVGSEKFHLFELVDLSLQDIIKLETEVAQTIKFQFLDEFLYEYFVFKGDKHYAKKVLEREMENWSDLTIASDNVKDYEVYFEIVKEDKSTNFRAIKRNLENYLKAFYSLANPVDMVLNSKIFKDFKNELKKINFSRSEENIKNNNINYFDALDSDRVLRKKLFSLRDYKTKSRFIALKKIDESRLHDIIVKHLNSEFKNGIKQSQFMRIHNILKDNIDIDVFSLDPKLQSYVLLEQIG